MLTAKGWIEAASRQFVEVFTTHTYQERIATLRAVREAGLALCSGGIIGMGEEDIDVVHMADVT